MKIKARRSSIQPNVDMTPMIDIVFQLILFFLVSTTFAVVPGIKLNLPVSHTAEDTAVMGLTVYAQEDGTLYLNENQVTLETLNTSLLEFDTGDVDKKDFPVMLQADSKVTNGTVVGLFDVLRDCGYSIINLRTKNQE